MNDDFFLNAETILTVISRVASRHPNSFAVEWYLNGKMMWITYEELLEEAKLIASYLSQHQEDKIGIIARRSKSFITGMLGIMMAKKAFVPIDPAWPKDRIDNLSKQLDLQIILDEDTINKILNESKTSLWSAIETKAADSAYFICSSGSTGEPKCIDVTHAGIPNLAMHQAKLFESDSSSRFLWMLSPMFDGSLSDIFVALSSGSTILIYDRFEDQTTFADTWNIADWLGATHIDIPPVLLRSVLDPIKLPSCVKTLIVGGEDLSREVVERYASICRIVNVYGPTESTICTSAKVYTKASIKGGIEITVGVPFSNVNYKLSHESELMISGIQLARGYAGHDKRTDKLNEEKFVEEDGVRWFKTGDLAEATSSGEWKILGRADRQVKINGKLVAPEEVEAAAAEIGVTAAVVFHNGKLKCIAEDSSKSFTIDALGESFRKKLPEWMVPKSIKRVSKLPRLSSGKISYEEVKKLLDLEIKETAKVENPASCKMSFEENSVLLEVKKMIANVLRLETLPEDDASLRDDLGADSMQFILLSIKIKSRWNIQFNACDFKRDGSARKIAETIKSKIYGEDHIPAFKLDSIAKKFESDFFEDRETSSRNEILLTGAAGFLGSYVLAELARSTDSRINCIVKDASSSSARNKILAALRCAGIFESEINTFSSRVRCYAGDLSKERFGLEDHIYDGLCERVEAVYHIAGEVNDWKAASDLSTSNIEATKNVIKFCIKDGNARLAFASTLSVFVSRVDLKPDFTCRETPLEAIGEIAGGYAQSKWIAEKIATDLVPASKLKVLRYGLLTEAFGKPRHFARSTLSMFLRGAKKLGVLPVISKNLKVDLTPVDIAARATVAAMSDDASSSSIIHVHAGMQTRYADILDKLVRSGVVKTCTWDKWKEEIVKSHMIGRCLDEDIIACIEALSREDGFKFGPFDLFQSTDVFFDRTNMLVNCRTKSDLEKENLVKSDYLDQLLRVKTNSKNW